MIPTFKPSRALTLGLELELQIVDANTGLLSPSSLALFDAMVAKGWSGSYALEATMATIEINSGVHESAQSLEQEICQLVARLQGEAIPLGLNLRGGGTHLTQFWNERRMTPSPRAETLVGRYGYLPKRFSTYGMHVHIGVADEASALLLANGLQALVPLLISMSAASPFLQRTDTGFSACRPLESLIYPHGGPMPRMASWQELENTLASYCATGLCESLKDIYWDVRPKPEFGTVEIRVFDTPLTVRKAVALAAFCRHCAALLLSGKMVLPAEPADEASERVSRFFACRDGVNARIFDPFSRQWRLARDWWPVLLAVPTEAFPSLGDQTYLDWLRGCLDAGEDAEVMRQTWHDISGSSTTDPTLAPAIADYSKAISRIIAQTDYPARLAKKALR